MTIVSKGWTKLDSGIVDSTLWAEDHATLRVWIALLAKCDAGGYARIAIPALARLCYMEIAELEGILDKFGSPDEYSRCQEHEGRRIARVEGGFVVLSYENYRNMRTRAQTPAERKQAQREREQADALVTKSHVPHECHDVTPDEKQKQRQKHKQSSEKTCAKTDSRTDAFEEFWKAYPKKRGKRAALKAWKQTAKERPENGAIVSAVRDQCGWESWKKSGGQFIPYPASWLRAGCWLDEPDAPSGGLNEDTMKLYKAMKARGEL